MSGTYRKLFKEKDHTLIDAGYKWIEEPSGERNTLKSNQLKIRVLSSQEEEVEHVGQWVSGRAKGGVAPHEFGVFVRSVVELDRARLAVQLSGLSFKVLDENVETTSGHVSISTMHLAKGLEFRAVVVMACDDEIIPLQERIETVGDDADLQEVYDTERQLLYVACTRARDHLLLTSVAPASEFLDDLRGKVMLHFPCTNLLRLNGAARNPG